MGKLKDRKEKQVVVTGGSGFIGRRLVKRLQDEGVEVTVIDLKPFPGRAVRSVVGDTYDPAVIAKAVTTDTDTIFHFAASTSVLKSVVDPDLTFRNNIAATHQLLEAARRNSVRSFIFASSNAVAGDVGSATITEDTVLRPLSPYGATKAAMEMMLSSYSASYGILGGALRFSNVYGPGMAEKDSFIPRLMRAALNGTGVEIYGDGEQIRDVVHVDDVVSGVLTAWRTGHIGPLIIASGSSISVNDMVKTARKITKAPIPVHHVDAKQGEMPAVVVDISRAKALGYHPEFSFEKGLMTVWTDFSEGPK